MGDAAGEFSAGVAADGDHDNEDGHEFDDVECVHALVGEADEREDAESAEVEEDVGAEVIFLHALVGEEQDDGWGADGHAALHDGAHDADGN